MTRFEESIRKRNLTLVFGKDYYGIIGFKKFDAAEDMLALLRDHGLEPMVISMEQRVSNFHIMPDGRKIPFVIFGNVSESEFLLSATELGFEYEIVDMKSLNATVRCLKKQYGVTAEDVKNLTAETKSLEQGEFLCVGYEHGVLKTSKQKRVTMCYYKDGISHYVGIKLNDVPVNVRF